jgi:hypothetical protein
LDAFQFELPSVEHPHLVAAALDEAERRGVRLARLSQGSGLRMLTDAEATEHLSLAHAAGTEVFTFISSRNTFDGLPDPNAGDQLRGEAAFADAAAELDRCVELGVDGVLVADIGLLAYAGERAREGSLGSLRLKTAAAIAPSNAATAALYEQLGASSINVRSTSSLDDMIAMRAALSPMTTIDIYVESPEGFGGGLRYRDVPAIVRELAPVMLKIGLRNAPTLYPYGGHLAATAEAVTREKVRRVELVLAELARSGDGATAGR